MIEKKLKRSAKKITMPNELKERILEKCDTADTTENTEITFTVEPFRAHRISRIISGVATIALAVGIAGYSGYLISRDGNFSGTEVTESITEENTEPPTEEPVTIAPFSDFAIKEYSFNGEIIPTEKRIEIAKSFSNYVWKTLDVQEGYMGGIAYQFSADYQHITVYYDDVLEYRTAENTTYYAIDFKEVNANLSDILYGDEFASTVPLSELDGSTIIFSGYRNFIPAGELDETKSQHISDFFKSMQWQEIEEPEIKCAFYPAKDSINFTVHKGDLSYYLIFSMNGENYATYTVSGIAPYGDDDPMHVKAVNEKKYFAIDENKIREALAIYLADSTDMYAPFGTLYKMTNSLQCESELYTGEISGDKLKSLSTAFLGWNWSDASYTIIDGFPEYTFSCDNFTVYVFADGTVVWDGIKSANEPKTYVYYNNVDGDDDPLRSTGDLCLLIEEVLMDNNPVVKIQ